MERIKAQPRDQKTNDHQLIYIAEFIIYAQTYYWLINRTIERKTSERLDYYDMPAGCEGLQKTTES